MHAKWALYTASGVRCFFDVVAATTLCIYLRVQSSGVQSTTTKVVNTVIVYTIGESLVMLLPEYEQLTVVRYREWSAQQVFNSLFDASQ